MSTQDTLTRIHKLSKKNIMRTHYYDVTYIVDWGTYVYTGGSWSEFLQMVLAEGEAQ